MKEKTEKNSSVEISKNLDIDLKIFLDYQNNYIGRPSWNVKTFSSIA